MGTKRFHTPVADPAGDFQLQLIILVAIVTTVFVGGFAVYRFLYGPLIVAVIDTLIVAVACAIAVYARRTGQVGHAGIAMAVMLGLGGIAVSTWIGVNGAVWMYTVILFAFYLAPPAVGLAVVLGMIGAIIALELSAPRTVFESMKQMASFTASATAITVFSWYFAARNKRQNEQLMRWATRDPLTGLENRRRLEPELNVAVETGRRHNRGYGLIIMDADNFKDINDHLGHAAGDAALQAVAVTIVSTTRIEDRAFRYGGDEFIIIMPDITLQGLLVVSDKLAGAIEARGRTDAHGITVSIGAALLRPGEDRDSWNRRADQNMYRAKRLGGNRYVVD
ncbi:MAG: diguanylate cyclase [Spirochaetaceae bacterium]|nr:MAG: diguanylate cyclase [Spirochaetaceae bacterium]